MKTNEPKSKTNPLLLTATLNKKVWVEPDVELISQDAIKGGTVRHFTEGYVFGPQSSRTGFYS